jgi:hypothetical protein
MAQREVSKFKVRNKATNKLVRNIIIEVERNPVARIFIEARVVISGAVLLRMGVGAFNSIDYGGFTLEKVVASEDESKEQE